MIYVLVGVLSIVGSWTIFSVSLSALQSRRRRIQHSLRIKPLAFTKNWQNVVEARISERRLPTKPPISNSKAVQATVDSFVSLLVRDFISSWHQFISEDQLFSQLVERNIHIALCNIKFRLEKIDIVPLVVEKVVPIVVAHLTEFRKAEQSLRGSKDRVLTESDELHLMFANKYRNGQLHPAVSNTSSTSVSELAYLRDITQKVLPLVFPSSEMKSASLQLLLREILACKVLKPVVDILSDPTQWNGTIDGFAGKAIRELNMVKKLREALERHARDDEVDHGGEVSKVRSYEEFLKLIKSCKSLLDAKRIHNNIVMEIRKKRLEIMDRKPNDVVNGVKVEDVCKYINKLFVCKRRIDKRIGALGGQPYVAKRRNYSLRLDPLPRNLSSLTLLHILKSASGLSYFMEFMDQSGRTHLLQFWLMAEGFRQHLVLSDEDDDENTNLSTETLRQDARKIFDTYFGRHSSNDIPISSALVSRIECLVEELSVEAAENSEEALKDESDFDSILDAQNEIYGIMESHDYALFKKSDLYLSFVTDPGFKADFGESKAPPVEEEMLNRSNNIRERTPKTLHISSPSPKKPVFASASSGSTPTFGSSIVSPVSVNDIVDDSLAPVLPAIRPASQSVPEFNEAELLPSDAVEAVEAELQSIMSFDMTDDIPSLSSSQSGDSSGDMPTAEGGAKNVNDMAGVSPVRNTADGENRGEVLPSNHSRSASTSSFSSLSGLFSSKSQSSVQSKVGSLQSSASSDILTLNPSKFPSDTRKSPASIPSNASIAQKSPQSPPLISDEISRIKQSLDRLAQQEAIVESLLKNPATQSGRNPEVIKVLERSRKTIRHEMKELLYQKTQLEMKGKDQFLVPGQSTINITSCSVGTDGTKEFALYVIEVHNAVTASHHSTGWIVARRYSEFFALHQVLKSKFPKVGALELPKKRPNALMGLQKGFVESRRGKLEKYLQQLIKIPDVCRCDEFRQFLYQENFSISTIKSGSSTSSSFPFASSSKRRPPSNLTRQPSNTNVGSEVTQDPSRDSPRASKIYSGTSPSTASLIDIITDKLYNQVSSSSFTNAPTDDDHSENEDYAQSLSSSWGSLDSAMSAQLEREYLGSSVLSSLSEPKDKEKEKDEEKNFAEPLCDLFIELFELKEKNNWLRRQAVVIILQQILGGRLERKLYDLSSQLTSEERISVYIQSLTNLLWPNGEWNPTWTIMTTDEKQKLRQDAGRKLGWLIPELLGNFVGKSNATKGANRLMLLLQNNLLNQHLVYSILDVIFQQLFPEVFTR